MLAVRTLSELTRARVQLAADVAARLGRTRSQVRLPADYAVLYRDGVPLARYADDQAERIRTRRATGETDAVFELRLSPGVVRWLEQNAA